MSRRNALITITILFSVSVLCRIPFLTRPLDGEHDWLTLHSLLTISIWNTVGLPQAHYSLLMTYPNPADRFISYGLNAAIFDHQGNSYFVAFPPLAFLLAFWTLKLFHLPPQAIWLKAINLAALLPATFLLYAILERVCSNEDRAVARQVAVLGVSLFLFNRAVLLSLGNLYFPLILVVPIWMMAAYFYCAAQDHSKRKNMNLALFGVLTFLACYCDWLGMAAAATFFCWSLFRRIRQPIDYWLAGLATIAAGLAGVVVTIEYSSISGLRGFLLQLASRFEDRAGVSNASDKGLTLWNPHTYFGIASRYREQYTPLALLLFGFIFLYLFVPRLSRSLRWTTEVRRAAFLFGLPVAIDHILLANHTAIHNYATLKAAPFLVLIAVFLMDNLAQHSWGQCTDQVQVSPLLTRCTLAVIVVCLAATAQYLHRRNDLHPANSRLGMAIRQQSSLNQVIFMLRRKPGEGVSPNLIYFAGRNIQMVDREEDARWFLERHGETEGILFVADLEGDLTARPTIIRPDSP